MFKVMMNKEMFLEYHSMLTMREAKVKRVIDCFEVGEPMWNDYMEELALIRTMQDVWSATYRKEEEDE